jgi:hypothetical protein
MKGVTRLTPIVPGEMQPVVWIDGTVKVGFVSGGAADGRGFPQWAKDIFHGDKVHWFGDKEYDWSDRRSLCGRVLARDRSLFLPGNYPRCKACEKAIATQKKYGLHREPSNV